MKKVSSLRFAELIERKENAAICTCDRMAVDGSKFRDPKETRKPLAEPKREPRRDKLANFRDKIGRARLA